MECFHIDESDCTGFDLLNPKQRFQGATAVAIKDRKSKRTMVIIWVPNKQRRAQYRSSRARPGQLQTPLS
jgi:hypothetical protein